MSKTLEQVFIADPIASNVSTDLMYFMRSPYNPGTDAGMTFLDFSAQFPSLPVLVTQGGTGLTSLAINTIMFASSANVMGVISPVNSAILTTSAGGVPSWQTTLPAGLTYSGSGGLKSFQVFTSGTALTYTRPAGITSILIEVVGGGGSGASGLGGANYSFVGGGGSGGYARRFVAAAAASYTYTVGAGGAAAAAGANNGNAGGTTTFNASSLQATGGGGGIHIGSLANAATRGGAAGIGTNGNINAGGQPGGGAVVLSGNGFGGVGGCSIYGGGGITIGLGAGGNASSFGSGGGGAASTAVSFAGGTGSAGLIVVWEFA